MKNITHRTILFLIIIVAAALRIWQIGNVPISPDWDEAALGYNSYSILQTGRDEYGKFLPVVLRSFDDYKPALYTYLIIPFIPLLDLSVIAVRLPSVIAGIIAVFLTYLLVKELVTRNHKSQPQNDKLKIENLKSKIPIISAALLALSPWHIQFSRVAFEANLGLTLNIAMVYFFLRGLRQSVFLSFSAVCAGLSIYAYQSEKLFVPLMGMLLLLCFGKVLLHVPKKSLIIAGTVFILVISPMAHFILTEEDALKRAQATTIFTNNHSLLEPSVERLIKAKEENDIVATIVNNRRVIYTQTMFQNYLSHFDPNWLFIAGDSPRHHAPGMGLLYLFELPFLIIGFVSLLLGKFKSMSKKGKYFLFGWLLIAPLPAVITNDVPHAVRTLNLLPTFQIFTAMGLLYSFQRRKQFKIIQVIIFTGIAILAVGNVMYYLYQYFGQTNLKYASEWQYGYKEAVTYTKELEYKYQKIIVSNQVPLDQSYIFFLFYLKYPPERYQQEVIEYKELPIRGFGKYEFRPVEAERIKTDEQDTLYMVSANDEVTQSSIHTIINPNGTPAIIFTEGK